jgi:hypothetical protein
MFDMKSDTKTTFQKQSTSDFPPFDWRFAIVRPRTVAGTFVARRFNVAPAVADLIADLAGLGNEVRS